jgi:PAS domain S-box-containing protein
MLCLTVEEIMKENKIKCLRQNDSFKTAIEYFLKFSHVNTLPVVDANNKLIGVLPKKSFFKAILAGSTIDDLITSFIVDNPISLQIDFKYDEVSLVERVSKSQASYVVVTNNDGTVAGMIGSVQYLKQTLKVISSSYALLHSVFQGSNTGLIVVDNEGYILRVNNAAETMFGINYSEIKDKHLGEVLPEVILSKKSDSIGIKQTVNSVPVIINQTPVSDNGTSLGISISFLDMSHAEGIAAELEIVKELQKILNMILNASSDGILVTDNLGKIKYINQMASDFFSKNDDSIVGRNIKDFLNTDRPESVIQNCVAEVETCRYNGRNFIVTHIPIKNELNGISQISGVVSTLYFADNAITGEIAREWFSMSQQVQYYKSELEKRGGNSSFDIIISRNSAFNRIKKDALRISPSSSTVLLTGESGVGKDMFARAIHSASSRARRPFVKVNCAAIPETLFESELFGYAPGSFTGASKNGKSGYFEQAHEGTIFLDEIGEMPLSVQVKILQVLQDKEFMRVGGIKTQTVDVRVIAATNRDLRQAMFQGNFREDLFYRLNVIAFKLPPLRERGEDILLLAKAFVLKYNAILGAKVIGMNREVQEALQNYSWPGNIRELENAIERAANFAWEGEIELEHLPVQIIESEFEDVNKLNSYKEVLNDVNKAMIMEALRKCKGNKSAAAKMLNISRTALYEKLAKYVLNDDV